MKRRTVRILKDILNITDIKKLKEFLEETDNEKEFQEAVSFTEIITG